MVPTLIFRALQKEHAEKTWEILSGTPRPWTGTVASAADAVLSIGAWR